MKAFEQILDEKKTLVWREIKKYLKDPVYPLSFEVPKKFAKDARFHWEIVKEYPQRKGKYLRPALLLLTAQSMGVKEDKAVKTAAAMQVSEDWLLAHDDFEDDSFLRRGKPTLHRLYGAGLAVNAGDTLHAIMWKILFDNYEILGNKKTFLVLDEFYKMLMRTALGQAVELRWSQKNKIDFSDKDWFFIADGKTSYYTISGPMRLGAIIAGANTEQLNLLAEFGVHLGRSFQLVDDILDLTSDFNGLKKQMGNDIYESKRTVILGHLLRAISKSDKQKLVDILSKSRSEKTEEEVKWIITKMQEYNSISYAKILAKKEGDLAMKIFKSKLGFISQRQERKSIEMFIHFVLERQY